MEVRVSYLQARALPSGPGGAPVDLARIGRTLDAMGWSPLDLGWAHDAQVMDAPLATRWRIEGGAVELPAGPDRPVVPLPLGVEVVAWSFGFAALRVEVDIGAGPVLDLDPDGVVARLVEEQYEWADGAASWRVPGLPFPVLVGNARRLLDGVSFAIHEAVVGRRTAAPRYAEWTASKRAAFERSERLQRWGELRFPYPTIGGAHVDVRVEPDEAPGAVATVLAVSAAPFDRMHRVEPTEPPSPDDETGPDLLWLASNYVGVSLAGRLPEPGAPAEADVLLGLLETLTVRRSVRVCLARDMQASLGRRRSIPNATVADWLWLHAAAINDSLFGGPALRHLIALRDQERSVSDLHDSMLAEAQVRATLQLLLDRVDAERDRVGIVSGVLFGIVATTSVASVTRDFTLAGGPDSSLIGALVASAVIAIVAGLMLFRSRRIRPPRFRAAILRLPSLLRRFSRS